MNRREFLYLMGIGAAGFFSACSKREEGEIETVTLLPTSTARPTETVTPSPTVTVTLTQTPTVMPTETQRSPEVETSFYDGGFIDSIYSMKEEGVTLWDIEVDEKVMGVVASLGVMPIEGDCTALLMRSIPTDWIFSGIRYTRKYEPRWEMVLTDSIGIKRVGFKQFADETLAIDAAAALLSLQLAAAEEGVEFFMASGFRSHEEQARWYESNPTGAGGVGRSEHITGLAVDLYKDRWAEISLTQDFQKMANRFGFVSSLNWVYDPPHYFYLDGVWPGLTQALIDAGLDPNDVYNCVQARLAVFRLLVALLERR